MQLCRPGSVGFTAHFTTPCDGIVGIDGVQPDTDVDVGIGAARRDVETRTARDAGLPRLPCNGHAREDSVDSEELPRADELGVAESRDAVCSGELTTGDLFAAGMRQTISSGGSACIMRTQDVPRAVCCRQQNQHPVE